MLRFWRNPEFVRHVRAELRPPRALTAAVLVLVVSSLLGLSIWALERGQEREFFRVFHAVLVGIQYLVLSLWCASGCGQAISSERQLRTYDFLRTTRLTATELMVGKILGTPIMAYFLIGCSMPISLVAGILGGYPLRVLIWVYVLMVVFALFVSMVALWVSMLAENMSGGAIGLLVLLLFLPGMGFGLVQSPFPGFAALSLFLPVLALYTVEFDPARDLPTLLGVPVSLPEMAILLYVLFGAWFVLMITRNLKRDREQIRLLSRWQAVGLAAFLNLLFFALLDPHRVQGQGRGAHGTLSPAEVSELAVLFNAVILFLIGLGTITPHEKLKVWWRKRSAQEESYLSEHGLPWPWLIPAALIAYGLLVAEAAGLHGSIPVQEWHLETVAVELFVILVFTTRDILFLQWCNLTRMKHPLVKGFLYLTLYYAALGIVTLVVYNVVNSSAASYAASLTPFYALAAGDNEYHASSGADLATLHDPAIYIGLALQFPVILILLGAISNRLRRPAVVPAIAPTGTDN